MLFLKTFTYLQNSFHQSNQPGAISIILVWQCLGKLRVDIIHTQLSQTLSNTAYTFAKHQEGTISVTVSPRHRQLESLWCTDRRGGVASYLGVCSAY